MNKLYDLKSTGCVEINDEIWFPNMNFNALIKLEKLSGKIHVKDIFPNYDIAAYRLYSAVRRVNDQLVFVPYNSEDIISYNTTAGTFRSVDLDTKRIGERRNYFVASYVYKQYIYMFPWRAECIVKYDTINHSVKYLGESLHKILIDLPENENEGCFWQQFEILDDKIYIPFLGLGAVAIFDIKDDCLEIKYLNIEGGCSTINYTDDYFYLSSAKTLKIYRWDRKTDKIEIFDSFPESLETDGYVFSYSYHINDKLLFFPAGSNPIISFDIRSGKMYKEQNFSSTYYIKKEKDKNLIIAEDMNAPCVFDYEEENLRFNPYCKMDDAYNKKEINSFLLKHGYFDQVFERENQKLNDYIKILIESNDIKIAGKECGYGKLVFDNVLMN